MPNNSEQKQPRQGRQQNEVSPIGGQKLLRFLRAHIDWYVSHLSAPTHIHQFVQNRDDIEDGEFQSLQYVEGMPTSIGGFKDHPM